VWSVTRIVHHMYCLYRVTSLLMWRHCELDQRVIDMAVRQWRTRLHMSRRKADTLKIWTQTYPVVLARCLYRTQLVVLVNDFNVYQRLLLIFVAVSVTKLIFVQQCSIRFVQLVILKLWWSIWHLLMCHRLLTFVYKNRHFVPIYSNVIAQ